MMEVLEYPQKHLVIGKLLLIGCLLFSITIIGENSSSFPIYRGDRLPTIDSIRLKSTFNLNELETKLNQYELKRCDNK